MLNTDAFIVIAGNPQKWDDETRARCRPGRYDGTFNSDDLCALQRDQAQRGRLGARLMSSMYGWSVRSDWSPHAPLSPTRMTKEEAVKWGTEWANVDPDKREFFASKSDLP